MKQVYTITVSAPDDPGIRKTVLLAHALYPLMDKSHRIQDMVDQLNSAVELGCTNLYEIECELIR